MTHAIWTPHRLIWTIDRTPHTPPLVRLARVIVHRHRWILAGAVDCPEVVAAGTT